VGAEGGSRGGGGCGLCCKAEIRMRVCTLVAGQRWTGMCYDGRL